MTKREKHKLVMVNRELKRKTILARRLRAELKWLYALQWKIQKLARQRFQNQLRVKYTKIMAKG
jgi:hypothetical protein